LSGDPSTAAAESECEVPTFVRASTAIAVRGGRPARRILPAMTSAPSAPIAAGEREHAVDVLRGLALLGIVVVNMEYYAQPVLSGWLEAAGGLDGAARWLSIAVFQAKSYLVFSVLFGYGLGIQLARSAAAGSPLGRRYARRLVGLFLLGTLHGVLLFAGDILMAYAVLGALLWPLRRTGDRELLFIAGALAVLSALGAILIGLTTAIEGGPAVGVPDTSAAVRGIAEGAIGEQIAQRVADLGYAQLIVFLLQGPMVAAAFLVGLLLARRGLLANPAAHRAALRRMLRVCLPIGVVGSTLGATLIVVVGGAAGGAGLALQLLVAPFSSLGYMAGVALLVASGRLTRPLARVAAAGRMSLTVYLGESIVAMLLFTGVGLGLYGQVGPALGLAIAVATWLGFLVFAALWWRAFRFGPFEWLLRSFTYWRLQPLRRAP
jgi:uncharacterized protein